jgi:hypothetical protein
MMLLLLHHRITMMLLLLLSLVAPGTAIAAARPPRHLRFMGMYDSGFSTSQCPDHNCGPTSGGRQPFFGGSDPALDGWTNFAMSTAADAVWARRQPGGGPKHQLLQLSDVFFNTSAAPRAVLHPDWQQRWIAVRPLASRLLANGTIAGFFFGDELVGGAGLSLRSLDSAVDVVSRAFDHVPGVILYENEAAHVFLWAPADGHRDQPPQHWANFTRWPTGLTHVSVDIYHFLPQGHAPVPCGPGFNCSSACVPSPSTQTWSARVSGLHCAGAVEAFYREQMYPRMAPHQRTLIVPGTFGSRDFRACDGTCFDAMMEADALQFFEWAQSDVRVEGFVPWHFFNASSTGAPSAVPCMVGLEGLPRTLETWKEIGRGVVA